MVYRRPRGTVDWYGDELAQLNEVVDKLMSIAKCYGFNEIVPPTFESLELFQKFVGDTTDVVQKELYTFIDKKGRQMALRPEGTSSVVRAYVENKLFANKSSVTKLCYFLNLFRYERPQNGRLREFHQFGIEYLNVDSHLNDIECLIFAQQIINLFNLDKYITLKINYLGDFKQRQSWMQELKLYFEKFTNELTEDSIQRLSKNPLRILDDKVDGKKDFVQQAPKLDKFLSSDDKKVFNEILSGLAANNIKYTIDDSLVRGLDYYTGVVFEFVYTSPITNSETTLLGGGRYSEVIAQTGGPNQVGLGFAIGIERLLLALTETNYTFQTSSVVHLVVGTDGFATTLSCLPTITKLRQDEISVEVDFDSHKKDKCAKFAIRQKAKFFVFITNDDLQNNLIKLENMCSGEVVNLKLNELHQFLKDNIKGYEKNILCRCKSSIS